MEYEDFDEVFDITYRQCVMRNGNTEETAWIPAKFAKAGEVIKFRDNSESPWKDGWTVIAVGAGSTDKDIIKIARMWKRQRKASDI